LVQALAKGGVALPQYLSSPKAVTAKENRNG